MKVTVTSNKNKLSIGADLVENSKNIIDHVNTWIEMVNYNIPVNIVDKDKSIQIMQELYKQRINE